MSAELVQTGQGVSETPVRVIIVDDDPLARGVVRDALRDAGVIVLAEAGDGREAVSLTLHFKPDVVVMDVVMPGLDGITATAHIVERAPQVAVVMLSANDDDASGMQALRAGAIGFLPKTMGLASLPQALRAARAGEAVVSRRLTRRLIEGLRRSSPDGHGIRPVRSPLTSREWEVLDLLCEGRSTDDIAGVLVLSPETVRSHVKNILRKLQVQSRQQAIELAAELRSQLVPPGQVAA
jgi:DNA-binding NarL/FixJ family response regulator